MYNDEFVHNNDKVLQNIISLFLIILDVLNINFYYDYYYYQNRRGNQGKVHKKKNEMNKGWVHKRYPTWYGILIKGSL